ncbi:MAG: hypothetical protein QXJ68_04850 [Methanocellales archaeon]
MENAYLLAIASGFIFGALIGRFITKVKIALVYESELQKKRAQAKEEMVKAQ